METTYIPNIINSILQIKYVILQSLTMDNTVIPVTRGQLARGQHGIFVTIRMLPFVLYYWDDHVMNEMVHAM